MQEKKWLTFVNAKTIQIYEMQSSGTIHCTQYFVYIMGYSGSLPIPSVFPTTCAILYRPYMWLVSGWGEAR